MFGLNLIAAETDNRTVGTRVVLNLQPLNRAQVWGRPAHDGDNGNMASTWRAETTCRP